VEDYKKLQASIEDFQVPDGESRAEVRKRVLAAFQDVLNEDRGDTIGIITHTTSTHMLLDSLIEDYEIYGTVLGNTAVTTIRRSEDSKAWEIVALNDLSHLEGLKSRSVQELEQTDDSGD
jgi:broad specificity phosphatase PhoE